MLNERLAILVRGSLMKYSCFLKSMAALAFCFAKFGVAAADPQTEKLKLEIERLKLENEQLKLRSSSAPSEGPLPETFAACVSNMDIDKCFEYFQDENEFTKARYKANVAQIRRTAEKACVTSKKDCWLKCVMMFNDKEPKSIPLMEQWCDEGKVFYSGRCIDLVKYYLGVGEFHATTPSLQKARKYANLCMNTEPKKCGSVADVFLQSPHVSAKEYRIIVKPLLSSFLTAKNDNSEFFQKSYVSWNRFLGSCKLEFVFEKPFRSSDSFIATWIRYKNNSTEPLSFRAEIKGKLNTDETKVFIDQLIGKTLRGGRLLNPGELIREEVSIRVDEGQAGTFLPAFIYLIFA
jgi:hypothetical protein